MSYLLSDVTIEDAIELFLTTVPRCIAVSSEGAGKERTIGDSALTNAVAGMFLFLLAGRLSRSDETSVRKMRRAFEVMWSSIHRIGGNAEDARKWLMYFSEHAVKAIQPADRIAVITRTVRERLYLSAETKCPLDVWPRAIAAGLEGLSGFGIRGDN